MRILVVGDSHGDANFVFGIIKQAHATQSDIILQLGDFGVWPGNSGVQYLDSVEKNLKEHNLELHFIGGNHEDYDQLQSAIDSNNFYLRPHIKYIPNGTRWEWANVKFGAIGGAFSIDYLRRIRGVSWWPGQEEAHPEDLIKLGEDPLDIFICHDTPYVEQSLRPFQVSPKLEGESLRTRNILLQAVIKTSPKLIFHGHWHTRMTYPWHDSMIEGLGANIAPFWRSFGYLNIDDKDVSFTDSKGERTTSGFTL